MQVLLINLEKRKDRKKYASMELAKLKLPVFNISGVLCDDDSNPSEFVTNQVAGCWLAHVRALEYASLSNCPSLIVEDDLLISGNVRAINSIVKSFENSNIDLLQIGYVETGWLDRITRITRDQISNLEIVFVIFCRKLPTHATKTITTKQRYNEANIRYLLGRQLGHKFIYTNFLAGTHAYLISPRFASILKNLNHPILFSADQFLMSLSAMKTFRIFRIGKSLVKQNLKLESDISQNRFRMRSDDSNG